MYCFGRKLESRMSPDFLWPACLPKAEDTDYLPGNRGILSGWIDPWPAYVARQASNIKGIVTRD